MKKTSLIFFIFLFILDKTRCQTDFGKSINILPGIKFGYNFGAGFDFGAHVGVSFFNYSVSDLKSNAGVDFSYDYFFGNSVLRNERAGFKTICINLLNNTNNQAVIKVGISKTSVRWGFGNRNKAESKTWGYNADISYAPLNNNAFIGYQIFQVNNGCMGLEAKHSNILYTAYRWPLNFNQEN